MKGQFAKLVFEMCYIRSIALMGDVQLLYSEFGKLPVI